MALEIALHITQFNNDLNRCESPIERIMYGHLHNRWFASDTIHALYPQQEIQCDGKTYRADFVVEARNIHDSKPILLAVECDGHDFHEKTKRQASRDKQRDRDFQAAGYAIMRFSGAEIVKDCGKCVAEIESFLHSNRVKSN